MKKNVLFSCLLSLFLIGTFSLGSLSFAKDMAEDSLHRNFSLYMISQFNEFPTACRDNAQQDETVEWMCTYHDGSPSGHLTFIDLWTQLINQDVVHETYNLYEASTWKYVLDPTTNAPSYYIKLYGFEEGAMYLTFIPGDKESGIMIGYAPSLGIDFASGDVYPNEQINSYR